VKRFRPSGSAGANRYSGHLTRRGKLKRVLIVKNEHLLSDGIYSLLARADDLDIVGTAFISSEDLADQIERLKPSALILEENNGLGEISSIIKMLKNCHEFRLIIIDGQKNLIHVYEKKELVIARSADLLMAIRA
jgi:DNA-binding NarL/FixJ family response regulator